MESNSPRWKLNNIDWVKLGKGGLIALVAAFLTYITAVLKVIDFGIWTPVVMIFWSQVVNALRKILADHKPDIPIEPTE